MSKLPIDQFMQDNTRTELEIKTSLEDVRDVVAELGGGYTGDAGSSWTLETATISSDSIGTPESQFLKLIAAGGSADNLNSIDTAGLTDGRMIFISNNSSTATYSDLTSSGSHDYIVVQHNTDPSAGQIKLSGLADWKLAGRRILVLVLRNTSGTAYWEEVTRFFNGDQASLRSWLGLGDAAEQTMSSGISPSNIQGRVLKVASSATAADGDYLIIDGSGDIDFGDSSADVTTLGGIAASGFVQIADASLQTMAGSLSINEEATIDQASSTGNGAVLFKNNGIEKAKLLSIGIGNKTALHAMTGAAAAETIQGGIQIDAINSTVQARVDSDDSWSDILTAGHHGVPDMTTSVTGTSGPNPTGVGTGHFKIIRNDELSAIKIEWGHNYLGVSNPGPGSGMTFTHTFVGTGDPYTSQPTIVYQLNNVLDNGRAISFDTSLLTGFEVDFTHSQPVTAGYTFVAIGECAV